MYSYECQIKLEKREEKRWGGGEKKFKEPENYAGHGRHLGGNIHCEAESKDHPVASRPPGMMVQVVGLAEARLYRAKKVFFFLLLFFFSSFFFVINSVSSCWYESDEIYCSNCSSMRARLGWGT